MKNEALLNEYISAVSSVIICSTKNKKAFLRQLKQDAENFLDENENATLQELEDVFGSPEAISASFIANSESGELKRKTSLKKTVFVAVVAALLIYLAFVVVSLIDVHTEAHGYIEEGIMCIFNLCAKGGAV